MTDLITEARELCAAATPGPWFNFGDWMIHTEPDVEQSGIAPEKVVGTVKAENAAFIARSRTIIPELCAALEKAEAEAKALNDCNRKLAGQNRRLIWRKWIPVIVVYSISLLCNAYLHGKPKEGKHNMWTSLIGAAINISLLWWGGFFNG